MIVPYIISALTGYVLGSVPFALIIGKLFFKTDIRAHGSGNLGGSNAGRVLGKWAGLSVMTLDILKVTLALFISRILFGDEIFLIISGLFCAIGHCFPVFAHFKGGKAVATMYGFLFGMVILGHRTPLLFIIPLASFLIVLFITRIVSVSSISSSFVITLYSAIFERSLMLTAALFVFFIIMTVRHKSNIIRLFQGKENKISWIKTRSK